MNYQNFVHRFFKLEREVEQLVKKEPNHNKQIGKLQKNVLKLEKTVAKLVTKSNKKHSPDLILTTILFNFKFKILAMQLETKQFVDSILGLVDHDTQAIIFATFSNVQLTSSDPSIFTVDTDPNVDGTLDVVGVAAGTATLTVSADATYTDGNTGQEVTANKTASVDVTVTAPAPTAENTDLVVSFSNPQPTP